MEWITQQNFPITQFVEQIQKHRTHVLWSPFCLHLAVKKLQKNRFVHLSTAGRHLKRFATQFTAGRQDRRNVNACYIKKTKVSNRFGFFLFFSVTAPGYWGWAVQIKVAYIQISAIWSWDLWKSFIATNCFPAWFREEKEHILWQMFMIGCD